MKRLTDFFTAQRYYARMSQLFYGLFLMVVVAQLVVMLAVVGGITYAYTGELGLSVGFWVLAGFGGYVMVGVMIARHKIKHGGTSIAKSAQAVRLFIYPDSEPKFSKNFIRVPNPRALPASYRRYHEFAEQLAIASGVPLPKLYVLPFENGVNGFVAGFEPEDTVMVLTQGAVDKLTNAELYGLIGHEFGHILHGDARLNLRMYVWLSALEWIYDLADALEDWLFDKINHNHMGDVLPPMAIQSHDKQAWVRYLKHQRQELEMRYDPDKYNKRSELDSLFVWHVVLGVVPLVLFRLLGVVGLFCAKWVQKRFNHEREFLADATSVQLTRSFDVVKALNSLQRTHTTTVRTHAFSGSMSHFFFADPKDDQNHQKSQSHPLLNERIATARQGLYERFGCEVVVSFDVTRLQVAHDFVMAYDDEGDTDDGVESPVVQSVPVLPVQNSHLSQNPPMTQNTPFDQHDEGLAFEFTPDKVVDGRLVHDWDRLIEYPVLYPQTAPRHEKAVFDEKITHFDEHQFAQIPLSWQIEQALSGVASTIALVHAVFLCHRHECVNPNQDMTLGQIYLDKNHDEKRVYRLPFELVKEVSRFDRRLDGLLLTKAIGRLFCLVSSDKIADDVKTLTLIDEYRASLRELFVGDVGKFARFEHVSFDHSLFHRSDICLNPVLSRTLYRASVVGAMCRVVGVDGHFVRESGVKVFEWLDMPHSQGVLVLLAFLISIQDNSLQAWRYERLVQAYQRSCLLMGEVSMDAQAVIALMHKVRLLDEDDWLCVLVATFDAPNATTILQTLATACVYDGMVGQNEYDLLCMLAVMWRVPMVEV